MCEFCYVQTEINSRVYTYINVRRLFISYALHFIARNFIIITQTKKLLAYFTNSPSDSLDIFAKAMHVNIPMYPGDIFTTNKESQNLLLVMITNIRYSLFKVKFERPNILIYALAILVRLFFLNKICK